MSILDRFRLDGQKAVVTGGGKGIGRGIALALAEAGADVLVAARSAADVGTTAEDIRKLGRRGFGFAVDVTGDGAMERLAAEAVTQLGGLTIWVNNAGGIPNAEPRTLRKTTRESWDAQVALNLTATWAGAIAASERMQDGGVIINLSSRASRGPHRKNGPYAATKAAVNSLTETLALELAPRIRVNAVAPGPVPTDNYTDSMTNSVPADQREAVAAAVMPPLGRLGAPEDIAAAVVYLASPAASWISGSVLFVTGGKA
ncbi:MAG: SDR family NAD(P)-dependent oxidoreductase [Hyphomonadaceae bacterium]